MEVLVDADAIEPIPTAAVPELLGLETARIEAPPVLAFDLEPGEAALVDGGADEATVTAGDATGVADEGDTAGDGTVEPTPEPDPAAGEGAGEVVDGEAPDPEATPVPPVAVPVAPAGIEPRYDDPSEMIVTAGGRPFDPIAAASGEPVGVTDDTIRIGGLVTESLAGFFHREGTCLGAAARFEQANQHDELTRQIDFAGCYDDVGEIGISLGLTNVLVSDEVFAVVPLASDAWFHEDVLTEAGVPYVGADRLPGFCGRGTPYGYGVRGAQGCPVLDARGFVTLVQPVLTTWLAARDASTPPGAAVHLVAAGPEGEVVAASRLFEAELLELAAPVVLPVLPAASDAPAAGWSSTVTATLQADPAVVFLEGPQVAGLPAALRSAGYDGEIVLVGVIDPLDAADPAFREAVAPLTVISPGLDVANRASPGWEALVAAAAGQGVAEEEIDLDLVDGYLAADFIVRAIAATPEPLSGAALAEAVNDGWWYPGVEGLACGSWWPASHIIEVPCVSVASVNVFSVVPVLGLVDTNPQLRFNLGDG